SVAPALALGNAVLLKPDPRTAVCGGVALARIFAEAGLPEGLLQVLPGGLDAGEAVVAAPEVSVISFTGSTAAGRKVGEAAGRLLVHESIADDYVEQLSSRARNLPVGDPAAEEVAIGPIIDDKQRSSIREIIDKATADGARLVAGGPGEGAFVPPTVLTDLT